MKFKFARSFFVSFLFTLMGAAFAADPVIVPNPSHPLNAKLAQIADRYFEDHLILNPLEASSLTGEARFDSQLAITIAPQQIAKVRALSQRVLKQIAAIDANKLVPADQMTYAVLKRQLEEQLAGDKFPSELMPIDQFGGLPVYLAQLGSGQDIQPLKTVKNYDDYLQRLNRLPAWIDQAIINMREGIKRSVVMPKPLIVSGLPSINALAEKDVEKNVFYAAIKNMPATFAANDRTRLTTQYRQTIQQTLLPAALKLNRFLETEYLPKTRASAGIAAIPNGAAPV